MGNIEVSSTRSGRWLWHSSRFTFWERVPATHWIGDWVGIRSSQAVVAGIKLLHLARIEPQSSNFNSDTNQAFHKSETSIDPKLRYPNPFYTFTSCFFEICFNIYLPFRPGSLQWYPSREFSNKNCICFLYTTCSVYYLFSSAIANYALWPVSFHS